MSGWDFLQIDSHTEMILKQALIKRVFQIMEDRDEALALRIANAVARSFGGS